MLKKIRLLTTIAALASSMTAVSAESMSADTVYKGAKVITLNPESQITEAFAIRDGRFVATGSNADMQAYTGPDTKTFDLNGLTVIPGMMDTHAHFTVAGVSPFVVNLRGAKTVEEALQTIKAWADKTPAGEWIQCGGWHPPSQLKEQRYLTREEIDSVAPNNPVYLVTVGHFAMANSKALELAGIDKSTPDPDGGSIKRDPATGKATGILVETAIPLVANKVPKWTFEQRMKQIKIAMGFLNKNGLTSVVDGLLGPSDIRVLTEIRRRNEQTARVGIMYKGTETNQSLDEWERVLDGNGAASGFGDEWLRFAGIGEVIIDGGMTLRTAYTREPYPDDPKYRGILTTTPDKITKITLLFNKYGWRVGYHCVGAAACDIVLDAFEAADNVKSIKDRRFSLIHASLLRPDQMERAKALGVRAEIQNIFMWDKAATAARFLGRKTANMALATRSMIDIMGINSLGAGSDFPVNTINPFINMYIMVTRKDPSGDVYGADQAITREEALRLYTTAAAHATFEEDIKGSIEPGKLADFVVISDDFLTVDEEKIKDITTVKTVVGGKTVYEK